MDPITQVDDKAGSVLVVQLVHHPHRVLGQPDSLHHHNTSPPPQLYHLPPPCNAAAPVVVNYKNQRLFVDVF